LVIEIDAEVIAKKQYSVSRNEQLAFMQNLKKSTPGFSKPLDLNAWRPKWEPVWTDPEPASGARESIVAEGIYARSRTYPRLGQYPGPRRFFSHPGNTLQFGAEILAGSVTNTPNSRPNSPF
jgi:hypothetical protein